MEMVTLKSFDNYFSANIILSRLQQAGIHCYLKDEYTVVSVDPIGGIKLAVNLDDVPDASKLLQQFEEEYLRSVECPQCDGNNIMLVSKTGAGNFITSILNWLFTSHSPEKIYQCQDCHYETATLPENKIEYN